MIYSLVVRILRMSSFTESHEFGCVRKTQLHGPSPCFHPSPALHPLPPPSVLNTVAQETAQNQRSDPVTHVSTSAPNFLRAEAKVHRVAPETLQEAAPCPLSPHGPSAAHGPPYCSSDKPGTLGLGGSASAAPSVLHTFLPEPRGQFPRSLHVSAQSSPSP